MLPLPSFLYKFTQLFSVLSVMSRQSVPLLKVLLFTVILNGVSSDKVVQLVEKGNQYFHTVDLAELFLPVNLLLPCTDSYQSCIIKKMQQLSKCQKVALQGFLSSVE